MQKARNPVLVLGGGLTGLGVAKTLGRRGIDIYLTVEKNDAAAFSRYCKKSFVFTKSRYNCDVLRKFLKEMAKSLTRRVVVYPTSDLDALTLSKLKNELPDDFHFVVGDEKPLKLLVDKSQFYRKLRSESIPHPTTYLPEDVEDVQRIRDKLTYPVFIKPSIPQLFSFVFHGGKGFVAYSPKELMFYYQLVTRHRIEVMFQEIVPGPPINSYQLEGYYNRNHCPTVLFARQRLRIWPLDFGNTTVCVSIPIERLHKEKKVVNELIRRIGYEGLMSAEFKEDERDGTLKFLEINARAWWHFWLSARCGADIIFSSYLDAIGEKTEYTEKYETGVKSIYLLADLGAAANMLRRGDLTLKDYFLSLSGPMEYAFFRKDDLSPFIMDWASQAWMLAKKRLKGLNAPKPGRTFIWP